MQVFVRRSDLTGTNDPIPIIATYEDSVTIARNIHGNDVTVVFLPSAAITNQGGMQVLASGWRDRFRASILGHESSDRITDVFPEHSQRNSNAEYSTYITQFGADTSRWPAAPQARKAEIDRAWNYVNAVRARHASLISTALPFDPTADAHWPARVAPYQPL